MADAIDKAFDRGVIVAREVISWKVNLCLVLLSEMGAWEQERQKVIEDHGADAEPEYAESLRDKAWAELRVNLESILKETRSGAKL